MIGYIATMLPNQMVNPNFLMLGLGPACRTMYGTNR
jgi:hypothetical protein